MAAENRCQCLTFRNVRIPLHRNHPCDRVIENKHVLCRPCAMNWHEGPCDTYYRESDWHFAKNRSCARCGHDSAQHRPRGENEPVHTWEELPDRFAHLIGETRDPKVIARAKALLEEMLR